jgi:elongation factor G
VDFTAEVERALRVCDGAVCVFDGMQGVETQSETVWMQANKFNIPRLGFINKLDRAGAQIETTLESVKRRLKVEPLLLNVPVDDSNQLQGLIDLPSMMLYEYNDDMGQYVDIQELGEDHQYFERATSYLEKLIEQLSNYDDELADQYLSGIEPWQVDKQLIDRAIKFSLSE